ncbi:MAG: peroxide stress protein YaaA [Proteobacteria bacterium]|nr:peroxide stress protein YaaA [Pseudomonadota bacterium]
MLVMISPAKKLMHFEKPYHPSMLGDMSSAEIIETDMENFALHQPSLYKYTQVLVKQLKTYSVEKLSKFMKISTKLLELNYQRYQDFPLKWSASKSFPAGFLFRGDTYVGLDIASFSKDDLVYGQEHLRILSGLYGVLRIFDGIYPYRLEMGSRLAACGHANLYEFWQEHITCELHHGLDTTGSEVLVNCASGEYAAVVNREALACDVIDVVFKEDRGGELKNIGMFAKKGRGDLARFVLCHKLRQPEGLKDYKGLGYGFRASLSNEKTYVFVRKAS